MNFGHCKEPGCYERKRYREQWHREKTDHGWIYYVNCDKCHVWALTVLV